MTAATLSASNRTPLADAGLRAARARRRRRGRDGARSSPPGAGEVLRPDRRRRRLPLRRAPRRRPLGDGRWPIVLGHEGAGVVDGRRRGRQRSWPPGDHVVLCHGRPRADSASACRAGRRTLCEPAGADRSPASCPTAAPGCAAPTAPSSSTASASPALPSTRSSPPPAAIPIPATLPLWQAALLGCGVVTGFGAVTHAARRAGSASASASSAAAASGLQVIAAARLAGAATIVAVDRRPEKLEHALRRGRHPYGRRVAAPIAAAEIRRAHRRRRRPRLRGRRRGPRRSGWPGTRCGRAAPPSSSGSRRVGVEVSLPAIEFLSEKSIVGSYYGSARPGAVAARPRRARARRAGCELADMVSHLIELDELGRGVRPPAPRRGRPLRHHHRPRARRRAEPPGGRRHEATADSTSTTTA